MIAKLLHNATWVHDMILLEGSSAHAKGIAGALPLSRDTTVLGSDVANIGVLGTCVEGQRVCLGRPSSWMNRVC